MTFDPNIKKEDLKRWVEMAKNGKQDIALEEFIKLYILSNARKFANYLSTLMSKSLSILSRKEVDEISIQISSATTGYKAALKSVYRQFVGNVYLDKVFKLLKINNPIVVTKIKKHTINQFYKNIDGALAQTDRDIVSQIRKIQVDLIKRNKDLEKINSLKNVIEKEKRIMIQNLDKELKKKNIEFFKMKDGQAYVRYRDGKLVNFEAYNDMATRTTTLNVERDAVEINEKIEDHRISEYYLRDERTLKTKPREVCRHIMSKRFYGKALIAHDDSAAGIFGIRTIDGARGEGAMGPNCRHSIRPLSESDYARIARILYLSENEAM